MKRIYKSLIFIVVLIVYSVSVIEISYKQRERKILDAYNTWYNSPTTPHKYRVVLKYDYKSSYSYRTIYDSYYTKEFSFSMTKDEAIEDAKDWLIKTEEPTARNIRVVRCEIIDDEYER